MNTSSNENSSTATFLTALRDDLRARRAERAARKQLERELASYSSPADFADLSAMLDRYEGPEVDEVREILDRVRASHQAA